MFAKRFFYVSAAILCLALAYQLGASSARAQASGVECVGPESAVIGHELWVSDLTTEGTRKIAGGQIPNTSPAIACWPTGAMLQNGEVWQNGAGAWVYVGTLPLSGPVPTSQQSWGQVKARYLDGETSNKSHEGR